MTKKDDLISRMDAVQATRVGPSDEWSRDTKSGYELAATDCMMNILKVPPADLSSPLGAVAMREACATVTEWTAWGLRHNLTEAARRAIRAIPLPDHAALLAAALKLPEVAAMRTALERIKQDAGGWPYDAACDALAALEASHE